MAIDREYRNCLNILAASLFGKECEYEETEGLWEIAQRHSVIPLICGQLMKQRGREKDKRQRYREYIYSSAINNANLLRGQKELVELFDTHRISYAIMKGYTVSRLYREPDLRPLGDIDILIKRDDKEIVNEMLLSNGYRYAVEQEHHVCYEKDGIHIEVHVALSIFSEQRRERYAAAASEQAIFHTKILDTEYGQLNVLELPYQLLSLLTHMERHMQDTEIGMRQLCDWAITVDYYRCEITDEIIGFLRECGLLRFAIVLTSTAEKYLGLPHLDWCEDVSTEVVEMMISEICDSGNMQNISVERSLSHYWASGANRMAETSHSMIGLYCANIMRKAKKDHPVLSRCLLLAPFFFIIYPMKWWIRSMLGKREKVKSLRILAIARKRKRLYDQLKLYQ